MADPSAKTRWRLLTEALPMLHRYVRKLVGDRERANEILQEVSLRMLGSDGPSDPQRYRAWGRGIVRHVLAHDWRMRQRALAEQPLDDGFVEQMAGSAQDPEGHLDARTSIARLAGDLDRSGLELLYRRYVLQETGRELAVELAQTPAAVRMRLMRLRSRAVALRLTHLVQVLGGLAAGAFA